MNSRKDARRKRWFDMKNGKFPTYYILDELLEWQCLIDSCKWRVEAREEGQAGGEAPGSSELMRVRGGRSKCISPLVLEEAATQMLPLDLWAG